METALRSVRRACVAALAAVTMGIASVTAAPAAPAATELTPRIYGGSPVPGSPFAVAVSIFDGRLWSGVCTAAMWRPRVLITNAHCVTNVGTSTNVAGFTLFPPGATAVRFANFLQGQSAVNVIGLWIAPGYQNTSQQVQPDDVAVLVLDADLAPGAFTRLATAEEATRWAEQNAPIQHVGYGSTGIGVLPQVPYAVTLPLLSYRPDSRAGAEFRTAQSNTQGICPGDSGSPAFLTNELGPLLLGVIAGGVGPCIPNSRGAPTNIGFVAIDYLPTLNQGLAAAGYATVPGAPQSVTVQARNRDVVVRWQPPAISPETVVDYHVIDAAGAVVCVTADTTCTVSDLPIGQVGFTVRARNIDNEGDARPIPTSARVTIAPPQQMQPPTVRKGTGRNARVTFRTNLGDTSAVPTRYVVRDNRNKVVCRVNAAAPDQAEPPRRSCTAKLPRAGAYRFRVIAETGMGTTPPSGLSNRITVQ